MIITFRSSKPEKRRETVSVVSIIADLCAAKVKNISAQKKHAHKARVWIEACLLMQAIGYFRIIIS